MSALDRFTAFLQRAAASYNEPPDAPAEAMWRGVEEGLAGNAAASSDPTDGLADAGAPAGAGPAEDVPILAPGYHAPPPPPRGDMWARIEASWALRRSAAAASAPSASAPSTSAPSDAAPRLPTAWIRRRGTPGWVAALAVAASLVLGIALGRGTRTAPPGETTPPTGVHAPVAATAEAEAPSASVAEREGQQPNAPASLATDRASAVAAIAASVDAPESGETAARHLVAVNAPGELAAVQRDRFEPEHDYVTARHLGRAATLLTAFRTDRRTPESQQDLALWARELLVDTRMFLGLSDFGSPVEQVLLEDLELVLIQIAGLGPGAPDFEWVLARESMERRGTLARLRAVSAEGEI